VVVLPSDLGQLPDYDQYATVSCLNCGDSVTRTMQTIVKMLEIDGFVSCCNSCRKEVEQEKFEVLLAFGGMYS
jgi:hypothetical protein